MMSKNRLIAVFFSLQMLFASVAMAQDAPTTPEPESQTPPSAEEASRALGAIYANMYRDLAKNIPGGSEIKPDLVIAAMQEALSDSVQADSSVLEANAVMQRFIAFKTEERNEKTRLESEAFLVENAKKEGVVTTKSGLQYMFIEEGKGIRPTVEDTVLVHYRGKLLDGTEFDSSYKRGEPAKFSPLQVIPGWTEGLCLLPKGSKARFFIPASLAYGDRGVGNFIPPHAALIFDVELVDVIKGEPIPLMESAPLEDERE